MSLHNPYFDGELLRNEARGYFTDVLALGNLDIVGELGRVTACITDIAAFGYPKDIQQAYNVLDSIAGGNLNAPLSLDGTYLVGNHIDLALELGGDYLKATHELVNKIPHSEEVLQREIFLVKLAESEDPIIVDQAVREVSQLSDDMAQDKAHMLLKLSRFTDKNVIPYVVSQTKGLSPIEAVGYLFYTGTDELPNEVLTEAKRRFDEVKWSDIDPLDTQEQLSYLSVCKDMFYATGDDTYAEKYKYFIEEMPDSKHKISELSYGAKLYAEAPERIKEVTLKLPENDISPDFTNVSLSRAYAEQKNFEEAYKTADLIERPSSRANAFYLIVSLGGVHLTNDVINELAVNKSGANVAQKDGKLKDLADKLLEYGFTNHAIEVIDHFDDPAKKIVVLKNIFLAQKNLNSK